MLFNLDKEVILINDVFSAKNLLEHYDQNSNKIIISFNFSTHLDLKKKNIPHNLVEDYLDVKDKKNIDETARDIVFSWYKHSNIEESISFKDLNLGWLVENELFEYILITLKNYFGILRIIEKEKPERILGTDTFCLISNQIKNNNKIEIKEYTKTKQKSLAFDNIDIPINFQGNTHHVQISRKNALKIKQVLDSFSSLLFSPKKKSTRKSILLIDFKISLYQDFLKILSRSNVDILLLNLRKPSISNVNDIKLMNRFGIKIINYKKFLTESHKNNIKYYEKEIIRKLDLLFDSHHLDNKFQINGEDFSIIVKEHLKEILSKRFTEAVTYYEAVDRIFEQVNIDKILALNDVGFEEKIILSLANSHGISGHILQHGIFTDNEYLEKFSNIIPIFPKFGFKAVVWGRVLEKYLVDKGISKKQICVVGSPRHDQFFQKQEDEIKNVLICSTPQSSIDCDSIDSHAYDEAYCMIQEMINTINGENYSIIVKEHPSQYDPLDVTSAISSVDKSIHFYKNQDILKLIRKSEIVICIGFSTVLLEAMMLGKPTILYQIHPNWIKNDGIISDATNIVKTNEEFKRLFHKLITDKQFKNLQIEKGNEFVEKYMENLGIASETLKDELIRN